MTEIGLSPDEWRTVICSQNISIELIPEAPNELVDLPHVIWEDMV
jgi:hypothetical protein